MTYDTPLGMRITQEWKGTHKPTGRSNKPRKWTDEEMLSALFCLHLSPKEYKKVCKIPRTTVLKISGGFDRPNVLKEAVSQGFVPRTKKTAGD